MTARRFTNTLLFRTFTFDFALVLLSIAGVTAFSLFNVRLMFRQHIKTHAQSVLAVLSRDVELPLLLNNRIQMQAAVDDIVRTDGVLAVAVLPRKGRPIESRRAAQALAPDESFTAQQAVRAESVERLLDWGDASAPAELGAVRVTLSLRDQKTLIRRTTAYSLMIGGIIVVLACILQYFRLRRVLKPLDRLAEAAGRVAGGEMAFAECCESVFEYGRLTDAFNRMVASLKATLEKLRQSEERYSLAVDGSNDGIWDLDLAAGTLYLSPRWKEMLGFESNELTADLDSWLGLVHPDDRENLRRTLDAYCAGEIPVFECEYRCYDKAGAVRWMRSRGKASRPAIGALCARIAGSQTDITESKAFDPLTRLPNRILFLERLDSAERRLSPEGHPNAVLFLDVDDFKLINDNLGHLTGDLLLNEIVARLKGAAEAARSAGLFAAWTLARLGGDEFALLLEQVLGEPAALAISRCLTAATRDPFQIEQRTLFITVSAGMAIGGAGEEILRDAATAMSCAKAAGAGQFRVFTGHMREAALERLLIEADLRHALDHGEFALHYQPKVRLADRRATDFEALIRWNHPTRGLLAPGQFIPFAEETGLINGIGAWVIRAAGLQAASWLRAYPGQKFSISVNVSPRQFIDDTLVQAIRRAIQEGELPAGFLNVEVTESTVMENPERASEILDQLHKLGVGIHVDDFGTGHSSLHCLRRYPFDTLKIDRSFVSNADRDSGSAEIIRAIVALGNALGLAVVAEGLERADQVNRSMMLGCTFGQGFFFGMPMPAEAAGDLLAGEFLAPEPLPVGQAELQALQRALSPSAAEPPVILPPPRSE